MDWFNEIKKLVIKAPESDEISIRIELPPVSLQSSSSARRNFIQAVRAECIKYSFLLT